MPVQRLRVAAEEPQLPELAREPLRAPPRYRQEAGGRQEEGQGCAGSSAEEDAGAQNDGELGEQAGACFCDAACTCAAARCRAVARHGGCCDDAGQGRRCAVGCAARGERGTAPALQRRRRRKRRCRRYRRPEREPRRRRVAARGAIAAQPRFPAAYARLDACRAATMKACRNRALSVQLLTSSGHLTPLARSFPTFACLLQRVGAQRCAHGDAACY